MKEVIMQVASFSADYPKAPIYVADLVRCKECKHWWNKYGDSACMLHSDFTVDADDFCSYGAKEGE